MALAACGSATETISGTAAGLGLYVVVSSDGGQSALDLINTKSATQGATDAKVSSGDTHQGTQICTTTTSHKGHSYTFTLYVSGTVPTEIKGLLGSSCSSIATDSTVWTS